MPIDTTGMRATTIRALPPPDAQTGSQAITLNQVRPGPRPQNEYVDSPGPHKLHPLKSVTPAIHHQHVTQPPRICLPTTVRNSRSTLSNPNTIISNQPTSVSPPLKKDNGDNDDGHAESIICKNCGLCRCAACTEPRELPSRWCCGDKCELSAEKALEYSTCFCLVKGAFYHCGAGGQDDNSCYENPCACCSGSHCIQRWTCITMMSVCFPCLCCYWPVRECMKAFTACYNKCRKKGCQCGGSTKKGKCSSKHSQTRRLLIESDSSSA
ncbi:hypothetical protein SNE40_017179 [Patella caerulea]|uniref:Sprouty n=1 Tax=Patella caerulea TaxID=87958 RepID=A0AAN8JGB0_PATCE